MKKMIHMPNDEKEIQKTLEPIIEYMMEDDKVVFGAPELFINGWANDRIKVYVATQDGEITGVVIVLLVIDPIVRGKVHAIKAYEKGEDMVGYVNATLATYKVTI